MRSTFLFFLAAFVLSFGLTGQNANAANPFIPPDNENLPNPPANPPPDTDGQDEKNGSLIMLKCSGNGDAFMAGSDGYRREAAADTRNYKINLRNHVVKDIDGGRVYLDVKIDDNVISFKYHDGNGTFSNVITISRLDGTYKERSFLKEGTNDFVETISGSCEVHSNQRKF